MRLNTKGHCPVSITCISLHLSPLSRDLFSSVHAPQSMGEPPNLAFSLRSMTFSNKGTGSVRRVRTWVGMIFGGVMPYRSPSVHPADAQCAVRWRSLGLVLPACAISQELCRH